MSRGYILVEVSIAYVLLSLALIALVPVFIISIRAGSNTEQLQTATYLSQELLEEVRLRRWDEVTLSTGGYIAAPSATPFAVDAGEDNLLKTTFDDIDDFNGWSEPGALDPMGVALADFHASTRTVSVEYVDTNFVSSLSPTDYKKVTVCTRTAKISPACLSTVLTNR